MFLLFIHIFYSGQLGEGLIQLLIVCSGDIEVNPGPKNKSQLSFCHWNLNGLYAHNFIKVSVQQTLDVTHYYDIICLSETFLDSSISNDEEKIRIKGYNFCGRITQVIKNGRCLYVLQGTVSYYKKRQLTHLKRMSSYGNNSGQKSYFFLVYIDQKTILKKNLRS